MYGLFFFKLMNKVSARILLSPFEGAGLLRFLLILLLYVIPNSLGLGAEGSQMH